MSYSLILPRVLMSIPEIISLIMIGIGVLVISFTIFANSKTGYRRLFDLKRRITQIEKESKDRLSK